MCKKANSEGRLRTRALPWDPSCLGSQGSPGIPEANVLCPPQCSEQKKEEEEEEGEDEEEGEEED